MKFAEHGRRREWGEAILDAGKIGVNIAGSFVSKHTKQRLEGVLGVGEGAKEASEGLHRYTENREENNRLDEANRDALAESASVLERVQSTYGPILSDLGCLKAVKDGTAGTIMAELQNDARPR